MEISLTNSNGVTVRLAIDVMNVYVLGYYTPHPNCSGSYFFKDPVAERAKKYVFNSSHPKTTLQFDGSYRGLENNGASRKSQILGLPALSKLVQALYEYKCPNSNYNNTHVARAFMVAIQAISEAARFQKIADAVPNDRKPTREALKLENNWSKLSKAVLNADPTTKEFKSNLTLVDANDKDVNVSNANSPYVKGNLHLLLKPKDRQAPSQLLHSRHDQNYATI
ncbi:ribosome-inactivating protein momordin I-like [Momordica charantia]|uniref:rRNA N-glycosylase n=1 Tax=Momordica charantia TaxID=3673 RepID=A0A6J1DX83_MOMCH|nr:ribosome-inactivating protein momordin I-like [Momordica charantia]